MQSFRLSSVDILIATDVAARGIDIDGIDAVINFDIPNENEIYVHRIGRTARAGATGSAITLATTRSKNRIAELEKYINRNIRRMEIPTIKEIQTHQQKKLFLEIVNGIENNVDNRKYDNLIMKLSKLDSNPVPLLVTLLDMIDKNNQREYPEIETVSLKPSRTKKEGSNSKNGNAKTTQKGTGKNFTNQTQRAIVEVNIGEIDKVRPNQLVVFFHDELKIHREHFGKIVIKKKYCYIEINKDALKYFKNLNKKKWNGRSVTYKVVDSMPSK